MSEFRNAFIESFTVPTPSEKSNNQFTRQRNRLREAAIINISRYKSENVEMKLQASITSSSLNVGLGQVCRRKATSS